MTMIEKAEVPQTINQDFFERESRYRQPRRLPLGRVEKKGGLLLM